MSGRPLAVGLAAVVVAVVLQTTLFVDGSLRLLDTTPSLVLVAVVTAALSLEAEPAIFLGFTGGLLMDLLGGSPLGLWSLVFTVVAYLTVRFRHLVAERWVLAIPGIAALALGAGALFVAVATLFGEQPLRDPGAVRFVVLGAIYSALVALPLVPFISWAMRPRRTRRSAAL